MSSFEQPHKGIHLELRAETTTAERDAQWEAKKKERQVKLQEAESRIPKLKPLMEILRESLQSTESPEKMTKKRMKDLQDRDERRRELMVLKETPLCETQWSDFQHDHMPSKRFMEKYSPVL